MLSWLTHLSSIMVTCEMKMFIGGGLAKTSQHRGCPSKRAERPLGKSVIKRCMQVCVRKTGAALTYFD